MARVFALICVLGFAATASAGPGVDCTTAPSCGVFDCSLCGQCSNQHPCAEYRDGLCYCVYEI